MEAEVSVEIPFPPPNPSLCEVDETLATLVATHGPHGNKGGHFAGWLFGGTCKFTAARMLRKHQTAELSLAEAPLAGIQPGQAEWLSAPTSSVHI